MLLDGSLLPPLGVGDLVVLVAERHQAVRGRQEALAHQIDQGDPVDPVEVVYADRELTPLRLARLPPALGAAVARAVERLAPLAGFKPQLVERRLDLGSRSEWRLAFPRLGRHLAVPERAFPAATRCLSTVDETGLSRARYFCAVFVAVSMSSARRLKICALMSESERAWRVGT